MARTTEIKVIVWSVLTAVVLAVGGCGRDRASPGVETGSKARAVVETPTTETPAAREAQSPPEESAPVDLALRFSPGRTAVYRAVLEQKKSVTWKGAASAKPATFKDGHTGNRVEMTFQQDVESVDDAGNAVLRITVKALTCRNWVSDKVVLDFDSARPQDRDNVLAKLIGQSYRIKLSRRGEVLDVVDAAEARSALAGDTPMHQMAQRLLSDSQIKERHTVAALSAVPTDQVRPGQTWSSVKSFSFSAMGAKSFERVYTLEGVRREDGRRVASIGMEAIPAAAGAEGPQATGPFGGMFDNQSTFDGQMAFDLDAGQVRRSVERMSTEWVVVDPETLQDGSEPAALGMGATWLQELEWIE
jgi:hypothetical protein